MGATWHRLTSSTASDLGQMAKANTAGIRKGMRRRIRKNRRNVYEYERVKEYLYGWDIPHFIYFKRKRMMMMITNSLRKMWYLSEMCGRSHSLCI